MSDRFGGIDMELSLLLLYEQLNREDIVLKMAAKPGPYLNGVRILSENSDSVLEETLLYVDLKNVISVHSERITGQISLLAPCGPYMNDVHNGIFVQQADRMQEVLNAVLEIFGRFQRWNMLVQEGMLAGKNLQEIFDLCAMVTPDTVYLTDSSMKMYVHSRPTVMQEISAIWRYQVTYGYMPIHIIQQLMDTGEMKEIYSHKKAFTLDTKCFNNPYTCRNIFSGRTLKAHIFIVSLYSKPSQTHKEIAERLGLILTPYICSNSDFSSKAGHFFENFFRDLLKRRVQNYALIQQQISIFQWDVYDTYSILAINGQELTLEKQQFLINYFCEGEYDCQAFENEGHIICVFHVSTDESKKSFLLDVEKLLKKLHLKGAASKNFVNICNMDIYYALASNILRICNRNHLDRTLYLQEDVGLYQILEACLENHDALELCHPGIIALYERDQRNGTAYLETLLQYLLNDRNALKAARALYIHRNTMNYRLEKLRELLNIDEESNESKLFMLMSILLLRYQLT